MSLRLGLALVLTVVLASAFSLLGVGVVRATRDDLLRDTRADLERALFRRVNAGTPRPATEEKTVDPRGLATAHLSVGTNGSVAVAEPSGPPEAPNPLPRVSADNIAALREGQAITVSSVDGSLRYLMLGKPATDGRFEIEAAPLDGVDATVDSLTRFVAFGGVLTLLVAVTVVVVVLHRALRPLDDVIAVADAVALGERVQQIPTGNGPREIRRLLMALDHMLTRQQATIASKEASESKLRRFISDASHELQTPVTSILGWVQLDRRGGLDAADRTAALTRIEAESRRLSGLVDDMLLLARLDEERPIMMRTVDLAAVAHDAVMDASAVDPGRRITLKADSVVPVLGDASRLRQVVDNLLRNSRVHTPSGTPVRISVSAEDGVALLTVEDDGPGIPPENLPHVFDRFWRQEDSRSRGTKGAGLGLAIVAALVEAHRGTISATNIPGGGARFTVTLPISETRDE